MKRIVFIIACTVVCVASARAQERAAELVPSITVIGTGEVQSKPDLAQINVGVVTQDESASAALEQNTEKMQDLMEELSRLGIDEKDIQTTNFSVGPTYSHDPQGRRPPEIEGYQVSNQVQIKVRKLSALGRVLDDLISRGANQVNGISFSLADSTNTMDDARRKAMADARRKAELYAKAARVELGQPLLIQEQGSRSVPPPIPYARMAAMESDAVPVSPGELTTSAQITVTYKIQNVQREAKAAEEKVDTVEAAESVKEEATEVVEPEVDVAPPQQRSRKSKSAPRD